MDDKAWLLAMPSPSRNAAIRVLFIRTSNGSGVSCFWSSDALAGQRVHRRAAGMVKMRVLWAWELLAGGVGGHIQFFWAPGKAWRRVLSLRFVASLPRAWQC